MKKEWMVCAILALGGCDQLIDVADLLDPGDGPWPGDTASVSDSEAGSDVDSEALSCGPGAPVDAAYVARFTATSDAECDGMEGPCYGFVYDGDGIGVQAPALPSPSTEMVPNCGGDDYVFCTRTDVPFTEWGVGLQILWGPDAAGLPEVRSLAAYEGIGFYARRLSGEPSLTFGVSTTSDWPGFDICSDENGNDTDRCYNMFAAEVELGAIGEWQYYEVLFDDLEINPYWGFQQEQFDVASTVGLQFGLFNDFPEQEKLYDFCIDDIFLIPSE